jgi:hypothetical protein
MEVPLSVFLPEILHFAPQPLRVITNNKGGYIPDVYYRIRTGN